MALRFAVVACKHRALQLLALCCPFVLRWARSGALPPLLALSVTTTSCAATANWGWHQRCLWGTEQCLRRVSRTSGELNAATGELSAGELGAGELERCLRGAERWL